MRLDTPSTDAYRTVRSELMMNTAGLAMPPLFANPAFWRSRSRHQSLIKRHTTILRNSGAGENQETASTAGRDGRHRTLSPRATPHLLSPESDASWSQATKRMRPGRIRAASAQGVLKSGAPAVCGEVVFSLFTQLSAPGR